MSVEETQGRNNFKKLRRAEQSSYNEARRISKIIEIEKRHTIRIQAEFAVRMKRIKFLRKSLVNTIINSDNIMKMYQTFPL